MQGFVKVADKNELSPRRGKRVTVESVEIALFTVEGQIYAVRNQCPHQQFPTLHEGILLGCQITCPMHGWTFDLKTGQGTNGGGRLKRYEVKLVGSEVWVEQPRSDPGWS